MRLDDASEFYISSMIDLYKSMSSPNVRIFLERRSKGEPFAYITGQQAFGGCQLLVTPAVLIRGHETELLMELIAGVVQAEQEQLEGKCFWDLCCGSGLSGFGDKKALPMLTVVLSDISREALAVAEENSRRNDLSVEFLLGDLLDPFVGRRADFVACNLLISLKGNGRPWRREVRELRAEKELLFLENRA